MVFLSNSYTLSVTSYMPLVTVRLTLMFLVEESGFSDSHSRDLTVHNEETVTNDQIMHFLE